MDSDFTPVEGRTVVLQIAWGEWRPAQIVKVFGPFAHNAVNLVVFLDGSNDDHYDLVAAGVFRDSDAQKCVAWATSRVQGKGIGEWLPRKPEA